MNGEKEYYELLENFTTGVVVHDSRTAVSYSNQAALDLLGLTIEQIQGKKATDPRWHFIREDGSAMPVDEFPVTQVLKSRRPLKNLIVGVIRPDLNFPVWAICNAHPEFDSEKRLLRIIVNFTDVTQQKKAEEGLKTSASLANKYLDIVEVILVAFNDKGNITLLNRKGHEVLGYEKGELQGRDWFKTCLPPEEYESVLEVYKRIMKGDIEPFMQFENQIITKTGERRHISWHNAILKNELGEITGILSSGKDITERKQLQSKLFETNALLQAAMDQSQIAVAIAEAPSGQLSYVNKAGLLIGGGSEEDLVTDVNIEKYVRSWRLYNLDGVIPLKDYEVPLTVAIREGKACSKEIIIRNTKNENRIVSVDASPVLNEEGSIIAGIAVFYDTTERSLLEKNLKIALESAKTSALVKSRFLDMAAHELRTPVSAFSLLLQFTQKKLEKGIPVDLATFERLRAQVERISRLVIELLDVSRLERGTLTLKPTLTNLDSIILQCIEEFKLRETGHNLVFLKSGPPIEIKIDATRIFQVLSNLIDNATKYTNANTPIEISVQRIAKKIRVSVKDYGQGITEQQQKDLFAPFSRGTSELTEQAGGLGLGLFISREIIALHGGTIGVTSKIGVGSTFYFELPE